MAIVVGFTLWLLVIFTLLFLASALLYHYATKPVQQQWLAYFFRKSDLATANFLLSSSGQCRFNEHQLGQLSRDSQLYLWGYWLIFHVNDNAPANRFIFKDSLTVQDQARLARAILRVQTSVDNSCLS
ncbi:hypothetical protein [Colwellia chukchiensis]|uniref:hypothetical protein n=1 Tax=Colwellia chukchiensis TaxID=641665 RepID=UPI000A17710F|nr:hypothetical protein [Colwellia chukchiensis]